MEAQTPSRDDAIDFEQVAVGLALVDARSGRFVRVNQRYSDILGYSRAELEATDWQTLTHRDDLREDLEKHHLLEEGRITEFNMEKRYVRKDGSDVWVSLTVSPFRRPDGTARFHIAVAEDITRRKRAEAALLASEQRTRDILDSLPIGIHFYRLDPGGRLVFTGANPAADRILGLENRAFIGKTIEEAFPGLVGTEVPERYREAAENGTPWHTEQVTYRDGVIDGAYEVHAFRVAPGFMASSFRDITERRRSEETLRALSARQEALLSAIPDIVMEVDTRKVYTWANRAGLAFFGDDVVGREAGFYFEGDQDTYGIVQPLFDGAEDVIYVESWQRRRDGRKRLLAWWCRVLKDARGEVAGAISSARDITEQRALEEQFLQAQKMESVGRLAGGVAHDFNNSLQAILGYTDMALALTPPGSLLREDLSEIRKAAERSAELTRQLLAFARKQTVSPEALDLNHTVAGMLGMLRRIIGEDIALVWEPGADLWAVEMDLVQVDQILANLAVNARDAIRGPGTLTIRTGNVVLGEGSCMPQPGTPPGEYVLLSLGDDGSGMDREVLDHLFEPFFTTKETGKGTGLGLATVYGIVQQNRGVIAVDTATGVGTTFRIYLPRSRAVPSPPAPREQPPEEGIETVLLAEDDRAVLDLAVTVLRRFGYTVLAAQSPHEAVALARDHAGEIHLLVTDVVMGGMNGRELCDRVAALRPGIRTLFMSGYPADAIACHGVLEAGLHFIQKPFSVSDLTARVREILDQR
ncbi:MAG: PAS domain S-box protein [Acidobacteria bacterium]|nr:PAS domain S-box protein [Acidobacteriota bacterium]